MHKVGGPSSGQAINDIATKDNLISISSGVGNVQLLEFGENNSSNISLVRTYDESAKFISLSRKYIYLNGSSIGTQIRDLETDNVIKEYYKHSQMHCYHHGNEIFLGTDSFHLDDVTESSLSRHGKVGCVFQMFTIYESDIKLNRPD